MQHILVIEDEVKIQKLLVNILLEINPDIHVHVSASAARALELAKEYTISLFIIDIQLLDYKGTDLANELRELSQYKYTPIIFATGIASEELRAYREIKCYGYLIKPFTKSEAKQLVNEVLNYLQTVQPTRAKVRIEQKGMIFEYRLNDILYVESFGKKIIVHMKNLQGKYISEMIAGYSLKKMIDLLSEGSFQQCHKSFIVNSDLIESINKVENTIKLSGIDQVLPIGSKHRDAIIGMERH